MSDEEEAVVGNARPFTPPPDEPPPAPPAPAPGLPPNDGLPGDDRAAAPPGPPPKVDEKEHAFRAGARVAPAAASRDEREWRGLPSQWEQRKSRLAGRHLKAAELEAGTGDDADGEDSSIHWVADAHELRQALAIAKLSRPAGRFSSAVASDEGRAFTDIFLSSAIELERPITIHRGSKVRLLSDSPSHRMLSAIEKTGLVELEQVRRDGSAVRAAIWWAGGSAGALAA